MGQKLNKTLINWFNIVYNPMEILIKKCLHNLSLSPLYLHWEQVLFQAGRHVASPWFNSSPEWTNGSRENAFVKYIHFDVALRCVWMCGASFGQRLFPLPTEKRSRTDDCDNMSLGEFKLTTIGGVLTSCLSLIVYLTIPLLKQKLRSLEYFYFLQ